MTRDGGGNPGSASVDIGTGKGSYPIMKTSPANAAADIRVERGAIMKTIESKFSYQRTTSVIMRKHSDGMDRRNLTTGDSDVILVC